MRSERPRKKRETREIREAKLYRFCTCGRRAVVALTDAAVAPAEVENNRIFDGKKLNLNLKENKGKMNRKMTSIFNWNLSQTGGRGCCLLPFHRLWEFVCRSKAF